MADVIRRYTQNPGSGHFECSGDVSPKGHVPKVVPFEIGHSRWFGVVLG